MYNFETTKLIYSRLQDDISRMIYSNRMLYNLTKDKQFLFRVISQYEPMRKLGDFLEANKDRTAVIFGAGDLGKLILDVYPNIPWCGFIDNNKAGMEYKGSTILSLDEFIGSGEDAVIIISPLAPYIEIEKQLLSCDIASDRLFSLGRAVAEQSTIYFEDFVPRDEDEVFVDAGVFDGGTTLDFVKWSGNRYRHIYMFEPSESYFERYYSNVCELKNMEWIKKGLWSETTALRFFDRPDHDISTDQDLSGIYEKYIYSDGKWIEIPVTSIDETIKDDKVTFIKMDIEGSELEALKGAEKVIRRDHPKLAVCLYHKNEDLWTLPDIILQYNPDYKYYIRHYSMDMLDTVLYAVDGR